MPPQVEIVFRALFDELRFMKRQQWAITNYGALILAAIYAVRQQLTFNHSQTYLKGAAILVAVAVWGLLVRIQSGLAQARRRLDDVHNNFFTSNELRGIGWTGEDIKRLQYKHWQRYRAFWYQGFWEFTVPLIAVLWAGAGFVYFIL